MNYLERVIAIVNELCMENYAPLKDLVLLSLSLSLSLLARNRMVNPS